MKSNKFGYTSSNTGGGAEMREQFETWFKSTNAYQMLESTNYFKMDLFLFVDGRDAYRHSLVQISFMTWKARQAEIDHLNSVLEERTKEWLRVIELGDYFRSVAKPLKDELEIKNKQIVKAVSKWNALVSILTTMNMVIVPDEFHDKLDELGDVLRGGDQ